MEGLPGDTLFLSKGAKIETIEPDYKAAFGEMTRLVVIAQRKLDNGKIDEAQQYLERANNLAEKIYNSPKLSINEQ